MAEEARLDPVHTLLRARDWQDRPQLDEVCRWWAGSGAGVCALVGIGGAGKTAIADRFILQLPGVLPEHPDVPKRDGLPTPGRHFIFSFYDVPNAETFIADLAAWLGIGPQEPSARPASYERVREKLEADGAQAGRHGLLLVLDGLEKVQETGARGPFGRIHDGRLRDLVLRAADGWLPGVSLLITSRFQLYDPLAQRSSFYRQIPVERLEPATAVALLRARGVTKGTDGELRAVAREQGFHALTVDLMGGYIGRFCDGDPAKLPPEPHVPEPNPAEDAATAALREQERKFARVAERYHEALAKTDPAALALLQRACLFRLGVAARTLADIFTGKGKEPISGKPLARLREAGVEGRLRLLAQMRLLEPSARQDSPAESAIRIPQSAIVYSVHPAIRDGFLAGLDAQTARRGHEAAGKGMFETLPASQRKDPQGVRIARLLSRPDVEYPSDDATLNLLEEIVYHTLEAGNAEAAWDIYWNRIGGYMNLGWRLGAYERGERICRAFAGARSPDSVLRLGGT